MTLCLASLLKFILATLSWSQQTVMIPGSSSRSLQIYWNPFKHSPHVVHLFSSLCPISPTYHHFKVFTLHRVSFTLIADYTQFVLSLSLLVCPSITFSCLGSSEFIFYLDFSFYVFNTYIRTSNTYWSNIFLLSKLACLIKIDGTTFKIMFSMLVI